MQAIDTAVHPYLAFHGNCRDLMFGICKDISGIDWKVNVELKEE